MSEDKGTPRKPPRDLALDWAVTRSVGALRRWEGRIWRWDGQDWHIVTGPNLTIREEQS